MLVVILSTATAQAQQPAPLNLQSALDLAAKQNLDLIAARQRRAVSLAGVRIAGQRPNPTFGFSAARDTPHEGITLDQPLELGPKRQRRIELAQQEAAITEAEISALARRIRRDTREAFYRVAFGRAESERLAGILKLSERLQQIARDRFEAGDVARLEVTQAELEVARAQADLQVARQRENISLSRLNALLNVSPGTPWGLAGSLADALPDVALQQITERAQNSNPDLQQLAQEQKAEIMRHSLLKAERIPDLTVQVGSDFNSQPDFHAGLRGGLSLALPVFSRNQGEIAQSLASQRLLDALVAATRRSVAGRVESAYHEWKAQQTQVELYSSKLLPAARQIEGLAEESYRAGKVNILFVLEAQRRVQEVERSYLESLLALQEAFAELEETVGEPIP